MFCNSKTMFIFVLSIKTNKKLSHMNATATTKRTDELTKGETFWKNHLLYKVINPYSWDKGYLRARCINDGEIERFVNYAELMQLEMI